jgi:predicted aconitase with swiveling domain
MRLGTAPAGFVLTEPDPILIIGSLVASRLYPVSCPIVCGPLPGEAGGRWRIEHDRVIKSGE